MSEEIRKNKNKGVFTVAAASALLTLSLTSGVNAAENEPNNSVWQSAKTNPVTFDRDLRNLPSAETWQPGDSIKDMPKRRIKDGFVAPRQAKNLVTSKLDALLTPQAQLMQNAQLMLRSSAVRALEVNVEGNGYTGVNPPDPSGDVGKNYYIQMINGAGGAVFSIYDKSSGQRVVGPTALDSLGSGNCASGLGDPIVLYDELAERWFLSEFSSSGNRLCIYVSQTDDPISGGWYAYDFQTPSFPDYPKYGVWNDAYYLGTNEGGSNVAVYALDRATMLGGGSAGFIRLATAPELSGFGFQIITPVDFDGETAPPASTPGYFIRHRDDEVHNARSNDNTRDFIELWQFSADFSNTSASSFTKVADIPVAEFSSDLCGLVTFNCFRQLGSSTTLDPLREPIMNRPQYRNFGTHESIVGNFVVDVDGSDHGGIRWFELRRTGGGDWALYQEGTYAPDSDNRWMGSVAMDINGNMLLAYSHGSSSSFPGLRLTGRMADDALGVMTLEEATIIDGTSHNASNRWGDYSHLAVDPVDGCTFWYTNEYGDSSGQWGTQIASYTMAGCEGSSDGNSAPTASFTASCTDLSCAFDASASTDSDGTIANYRWSFGDGESATGVETTHAYSGSGSFNVTLIVTDDLGKSAGHSQSVTVIDPNGDDNELQNGVAVSLASASQDDQVFYTIIVPEGASNLSIDISGGSGDADLYVSFGAEPTLSSFDCRPFRFGNTENCSFSTPQAGIYYIMIHAFSDYSGATLVGSYTE